MKKLLKALSITGTVLGGIVTLGGIGILATGCNWHYSLWRIDDNDNETYKVRYGVAASNYGKILIEKGEIDISTDPAQPLLNEGFKSIGNDKSYGQWRKDFSKFVVKGKEVIDGYIQRDPNNKKYYEWYSYVLGNLQENVDLAYNLMVSGAVLFPIFFVVLVLGITGIVLSKKNKSKETSPESKEAAKSE